MNIDRCSPTARAYSIARIAAVSLLVLGGACRPAAPPPEVHHPSTAPGGNPNRCELVITDSIAHDVFNLLKDIHAHDRCVLHGLTTQQSVMRISWARDNTVIPAAVVMPRACAPRGDLTVGRYAIEESADFQRACPATYAAMTSAFRDDAPGPAHSEQHGMPARRRVYWILALLALGAAAPLAWRVRASRRARDGQRA